MSVKKEDLEEKFLMSLTKWDRTIIALGYAVLLLTMILGVIACMGKEELSGVFTNGKSENCASFISIEFNGDRFVSTINMPLNAEAATREHIADRVELSTAGEYFIRITQRGNFYIAYDGYTENITKMFPYGGVICNQFSQSGNEITIAQTNLTKG